MKPLEFLRTPAAQHVLRRGATAAAVPVSLHYMDGRREGLRVISVGSCAACRHVNGLAPGRKACRQSREEAAAAAARRKTPVPFVCHMGFACVAISALRDAHPEFVLTFGPYCPANAAEALEVAAVEALEECTKKSIEEFPTSLDDIYRIPPDAVSTIAEWVGEALSGLWADMEEAGIEGMDEEILAPPGRTRRRPAKTPDADPYHAAEIAAALAGGNQTQARAVLRAVLSEACSQKRVAVNVRRARAVTVVAAVLEALERAGIQTATCWERFAEGVARIKAARSVNEWAGAALSVLSVVSRKARRRKPAGDRYGALQGFLKKRLAEQVTLNKAAAELGVNPTAVTHHLQRKFGMSFSEYLGRLRVDKAKELLRRTELSVGAVARRVGIDDVSNFGKLFRKFENRSPLQYRKQHRN